MRVGQWDDLQAPDPLLLAALRAAPRRYRMPALPPTAAHARAAGPEAALAYAMEQARCGRAASEDGGLFSWGLAQLIRQALAGDPAFRALVLRASDPHVAEYARLGDSAAADRRAVRSAVDAIAHPGKRTGPGRG